MSIATGGIRISGVLVLLCGVLFFFNKKPKFLVPINHLRQTGWFMYTLLL